MNKSLEVEMITDDFHRDVDKCWHQKSHSKEWLLKNLIQSFLPLLFYFHGWEQNDIPDGMTVSETHHQSFNP
jgi:hypothetical protein